MSDVLNRVRELSPAKRALLERRLAREKSAPAGGTMPHRPVDAPVPLSFEQEDLWLLQQMQSDASACNRPAHVRLIGPLDVTALESALASILARHESLRSTFPLENGGPVVRVTPARAVSLAITDVSDQRAGQRQRRARQLAEEHAARPFDMARGPLYRAALLRLSSVEHILLLCFHHIVFDGWSMQVFLRELAEAYESSRAGQAWTPPPLAIQYGDYAHWGRATLAPQLAEQLDYWKRQLAGVPGLDQPMDRPRGSSTETRTSRVQLLLPAELAQSLRSLAAAENGTLFMVLLAGFAAMLRERSGRDEFGVGVPIAGRNSTEVEQLIGLFVNTLVIRTRAEADETFRTLLARIRQTALDAYAHALVPLGSIVRELRCQRMAGRQPLFDVMFQLRNLPRAAASAGELQFEEMAAEGGAGEIDLGLDVIERPDGLLCIAEYRTDLFNRATIKAMLTRMERILATAVASPDARLQAASPAGEATHNLREVNPANVFRTADPASSTFTQLFEEQVNRTPDRVAVEGGRQSLTYAHLNARANQLAHRLQREGIGPESLVGLCMPRCIEMVVGMLGVMKAGGAYVPLDPSYPPQRLAMMLEDCRPSVLLGARPSPAAEIAGEDARAPGVIRLDPCWREFAGEDDTNPPAAATASNLAYVIYTSGSTGRPKGVLIEHRSLVNYLQAVGREYALRPDDRMLQFSSFSFDASVDEIHLPLLSGGTVVLRTDEMLDPVRFVRECGEMGITALGLPTAFWHELTDAIAQRELKLPPSVRTVIIGGERALPDRLRQWMQHVGAGARLMNSYGPTETTVAVTTCELSKLEQAGDVPIGRPIANVAAHVLDEHMEPVAEGELYVGGACLARGYLNRPEEMRRAFVPDPRDATARLYRTGDRVRRLANGTLYYVGRIDDQVKIRGFRVELGEVAAAILRCPGVRQAAVVAQAGPDGRERLAAYVAGAASPEELRSALKSQLPEHMVPAAITVLDALPTLPNGKIDRRALPGVAISGQSHLTEASQTPLQELLATLWCDVLGVPAVGATDDFFDLGGHSLLATRLISRVRDLLGVELTVRAIFDHPTLLSLSACIEAARRNGAIRPPKISRRANPSEPAPLSFAQERLWFVEQLEPHSSAYHVPLTLKITGAVEPAALQGALDCVVARHESLRTSITAVDGRPMQIAAPSACVQLKEVDLSAAPADQRESLLTSLLRDEGSRPFDLAAPPLARAMLVHLSPADHVLLLVFHHIICDGWSVQTLMREMSDLLAGAAGLAPLPIQYADYAAWQRTAAGEALARDVDAWAQQLAGIPALLDLPTDRPRPAVQTYRGRRESLQLSRELSDGIAALGRKLGVTSYMTLLAALDVLLGRLAGQADVVIGCPVAGRTSTQIEPLVGLFVNTLALRTSIGGNPTFSQLAARVRETTLWAHAHQDAPMEKIVERLNPERTLAHTPLFQVMFTMLNLGGQTLRLPGATSEIVAPPELGSKYDLTLYARDRAGSLQLDFVYNGDLFDAARVQGMLRQLERVLRQLVQRPDCAVDELSLRDAVIPRYSEESLVRSSSFSLSAPDSLKAELQTRPNDGLPDARLPLRGDFSIDLVARLADRAAARAAHAAIVDPAVAWTYAQLEQLSSQLAAWLNHWGVGRGDVVAIYGHRSAPLVIAVFGVMKSGAAFTIVDPAYPAARLIDCLRIASPVAWISIDSAGIVPAALADFIAGLHCRCELRLGTTAADLAAELRDAPAQNRSPIGPDDLMYIAFTSGTTGAPRAVAGTTRPVAHFLDWQARTFGLTEHDRFSLLSGLAHDPLLRDVLAPLWSGATLCIPEPAQLREPGYLAHWMRQQRITTSHLTPAMGQLLCAGAEEASLTELRHAFFAGDVLTGRDVAALRRIAPGAACVNFYGTTETPQAMAWHRADPDSLRPLPLGRGIDDVHLLVLNRAGQLCGVGELGEICVRTPYLTRGYLNDDALTRERFIGSGGERLYRTGDMGRYRPDGNVELAGRADQQVKVRGHRVEPAEVEAAVMRHPAVAECAVVPARDSHGYAQLVAHIVWRVQPPPAPGDLRKFLSDLLPDFMVPARFMGIAALPLTPNGKVDRAVLAALPLEPGRNGELVPPRTMVESLIVGLFRELLGANPVGVRDNFFDLGGHSLLAVTLMERIRQRTGRALPVATLFAGATPEHLAQQLLSERKGHSTVIRVRPVASPGEAARNRRTGVPPVSSVDTLEARSTSEPASATPATEPLAPLFFVHGDIYGDGLYCASLARDLNSGRPFYALRPLDGANPPRSIEAMAAEYVRQIRAVRPRGPYYLGGFCNGGLIAYEMARQLRCAGEKVPLVAIVRASATVVRERGLHRLVAAACGLLGLSDNRRQDVFIKSFRWLAKWRRARRGGAGATVRFFSHVGQSVFGKLSPRDSIPAPVAELDGEEARHQIMGRHRAAMSAYLPRPYAGRLLVCWPEEERSLLDGDPSAGWRHIAPNTIARWTPGGHLTCLTDHVADLARILRAEIDAAEGA